MIAEKEIAAMSSMSRVQERIQENERQLTLDRQSLAHMENSSWRHMDDLHCALGGVTDQEPSLFERTMRRMKAGINELEEANIVLRQAQGPDVKVALVSTSRQWGKLARQVEQLERDRKAATIKVAHYPAQIFCQLRIVSALTRRPA